MQVAEWAGISRARTNWHVTRGNLYRDDAKKKIPTSHAGNRAWLLDRIGFERNELQAPGRPKGSPSPLRAPSIFDPPGYERPTRTPAAPADSSDSLDTFDWDAVMDALAANDMSKLSSAAVQKVQRLEQAAKTRVEHQAKRGLLIERRLVSSVLGRLYQVDSDQIKPLGAKVAPEIGALCGVEDTATLLEIEQLIDQNTHRILSHIKRMMDDFLVGVGTAPLEGA